MFGNSLRTTEEVLDFSFRSLNDIECILDAAQHVVSDKNENVADNNQTAQKTKMVPQKSYSRCLLLNNNQLTELDNLPMALKMILFNPFLLAWLDLSFNMIEGLPPIFKTMSSLKILYLHGNQICSMDTLQNIKVLNKTLLKLTLHGNPIEDIKNYRLFLINMMTNVKELDFSLVTESERKVASFLMRPRRRSLRKRKPSE